MLYCLITPLGPAWLWLLPCQFNQATIEALARLSTHAQWWAYRQIERSA